jgi:hypothetical protein
MENYLREVYPKACKVILTIDSGRCDLTIETYRYVTMRTLDGEWIDNGEVTNAN